MGTADAEAVVPFLREAVGEDLQMVAGFTESESDVVYGEAWFEEFTEREDTRSPEKMHEDAVYRLQQADLSGDLYGVTVHSECRVTDSGIGIYLFPSESEGVFVWLARDAAVQVPDIVDDCLARIAEEAA